MAEAEQQSLMEVYHSKPTKVLGILNSKSVNNRFTYILLELDLSRVQKESFMEFRPPHRKTKINLVIVAREEPAQNSKWSEWHCLHHLVWSVVLQIENSVLAILGFVTNLVIQINS